MKNKFAKLIDPHCVIQDKEQNFFWVINLEDHPNSFLLGQNYQHLFNTERNKDHESMMIIQPGN
ncbi:MAG: hypothetical protein K9H49_08270 [Bacteroidales bacterium]|nr:hypothetical protein [Bacteroidales bacterium]